MTKRKQHSDPVLILVAQYSLPSEEDPKIAKEVILNHLNTFHYISKGLKLDRDMCEFVFQLVSNKMQSQEPSEIEFIQHEFLPKMNITTKYFLQLLLKHYPMLFEYLPSKFKSDYMLALQAVKRNASMIRFVSKKTRCYYKLMVEAFSTDFYVAQNMELGWGVEKFMKPFAAKESLLMKKKLFSCISKENAFSDISISSLDEKEIYDFHFYYMNQ
ncbi:hypothetical protein FDP41_013748 [Naegleria fowleri]|uniref:DUF4116 domain-containing protein n=1 Tax=Naegleria fowleri TaxID=5763 RepID=A0A6A5C1W8_NAEFO|nr:uncharacterized protein FDP41_013748 [Naegleria fowleri]KAF0980534.1 hypothetical protein FDP41_013748 [Naegleria fowleri]